jgi:hypothetical protein
VPINFWPLGIFNDPRARQFNLLRSHRYLNAPAVGVTAGLGRRRESTVNLRRASAHN